MRKTKGNLNYVNHGDWWRLDGFLFLALSGPVSPLILWIYLFWNNVLEPPPILPNLKSDFIAGFTNADKISFLEEVTLAHKDIWP